MNQVNEEYIVNKEGMIVEVIDRQDDHMLREKADRKDKDLNVLPLEDIAIYVDEFIEFARDRKHVEFLVTKIGCGLSGYKPNEIAPLFKDAPNNCNLPEGWCGGKDG